MKLIEGYRSFLSTLSITDKEGLLYYPDDKPVMFVYNKVKRQMALPTSAMIKNGMVDKEGAEAHPFHPLCEDVLRGESGTIRYLKKEIRFSFIMYSIMMIKEIIRLKKDKVNVRATHFTKFLANTLDGVKNVTWDDKLAKSFETVSNVLVEDFKESCNIFITNKTKVDGEMYLRVANVTTILDELGEEGADFFGRKLERKVDKVVIVRLLNSIMGWIPQETGSNDNCPYFGCLARAWFEYIRNYNQLARTMKEHSFIKPLAQDWFVIVQEMERYRNLIQTMPYNTGPRDSTTSAAKVDNYSLGSNVQQDVVTAAPLASSEPEAGKIDIYSALGVDVNKVEAGLGNIDLSIYTPAQQEILRSGARFSTESVLDRRLVELPPEKDRPITERVGTSQNRGNDWFNFGNNNGGFGNGFGNGFNDMNSITGLPVSNGGWGNQNNVGGMTDFFGTGHGNNNNNNGNSWFR